MFGEVIGSIVSMAKEKIIDHGLEIMWGKISSDSGSENLERNYKLLMARMDDLNNDIDNQVQGGKKRKRKEVQLWFQEVKKLKREYLILKKEEKERGFIKQIIFGGDEAIQLNAKIRELDDQSRRFNQLVAGDNTSGQLRPTKELEGEAFKENLERIWKLLEIDKMSSIGVHGMGGVGKSALVAHVNNRLVERKKCVYWVVVSRRCSIKVLQDKIARELCLSLSDEDDEGARAGRLKHALSRRENLVLILDNVWEHLDLVKVGLPLSTEGFRWIMTSRLLNVYQEMNCEAKIEVKPLSKDEGWNLFTKNLGQDATSALTYPRVEGIAKRTVDICDGLPLGINTLVGAMSSVTDIQGWRHALKVLKKSTVGHEQMEEEVLPVLRYSFDQLSPNDQRCFLHCSLYPEDYRITKAEWFRTFITGDLADKTKTRAAQCDEAHSVVTRLVKVSLLESVCADLYKGECVKMHDLVRAMAHKINKGKTMVVAGEKYRKEIPIVEEWTEDLEKVSLMMNSIEEIPHGMSPNCPKLSTLFLQRNPLRGIPTTFFSQMRGLCSLDLSRTQITHLPDNVSDLVELTSLLLGECRKLQNVPSLEKLKALRELDLSLTAIENVPQGMEQLVDFRCLSMNGANKLSRTSFELKSSWLQLLRLPHRVQAELVEGDERLEVFEGWMKEMSNFNRLATLKKNGVSYCIMVSYSGERCSHLGSLEDGKKRLFVSKYTFKEKELPISAEYIQHLEFRGCKGMSKCLLDDLRNPTSLNKLTIRNSRGIECVLTYDQYKAPQHRQKSPYQDLEQIELFHLDDFSGVIQKLEIEAATPPPPFSSLTRLTIFKCRKVRKLGLPISVFEKLEHISIKHCEEIEEIIQANSLNISLPNLKHLSLVRLPSLESFCDAVVLCNAIETFEFKDCPSSAEPSLNRGTTESYKPLFAGISSSAVKKEWWKIDLFKSSSL